MMGEESANSARQSESHTQSSVMLRAGRKRAIPGSTQIGIPREHLHAPDPSARAVSVPERSTMPLTTLTGMNNNVDLMHRASHA